MTGKKTIHVSFILLIIASVIPASVSGRTDPATVVSLVLPPEDPEPGESLLINVTIADVTDMVGIQIMLGYNNTVLHAKRVYPTDITDDATDWLPVNESIVYNPDRHPTINNTRTYAPNYSYVWVGAGGFTSYTSPDPYTQDPVFTINFTAIAMGNCTLDVFIMYDDTIYPDEVELLDSMYDPIEHEVVDESVTVVPEFPTFMIMPLLLITSLAAAFLGKTFWSRKRKDALIAE